jgi:hypothetical protein
MAVLETAVLPITPSLYFIKPIWFSKPYRFLVDEVGVEPTQLRLQRSALPLELFIHFELHKGLEPFSFDLQSNT